MPFLFVHGVNTRADEDYERVQALRNAFLRQIVAPVVGISTDTDIRSPYWGGEGVKFRRNLAVVPGGGKVETFGSERALPPSIGLALAERAIAPGDRIEDVARKAPDVAVDLLWDYAAAAANGKADFDRLAASYRIAIGELEKDAGKTWLAATAANTLADAVFDRIDQPEATAGAKGQEAYGDGAGLYARLREAAKRIALKPADALAGLAADAARLPLTHAIGTFVGDAFQYLSARGDGATPGRITEIVLTDLRAAREQADATGEPLVVVCHSFGGEIVYDILTHYAPGFRIDVWVTVGSQVGLFEEMSLLLESANRAELAPDDAVAAPASVKRWLNIADPNDIFGFLVVPVFTAAKGSTLADYVYDTGYPVAGAHSGYFEWPSFYRRLAQRLQQK